MEILLIRHGMTQGNLERRYVGRTDEFLLPSAAEELKQSEYRSYCPELVYSSPMRRCRQTTEILFPELLCGESEFCGTGAVFSAGTDAEQDMDAGEEAGRSSDRNCLILCEGLKEMDFGIFEYKTYEELKGLPDYRKWIDSGGIAAAPGVESGIDFRERCRASFLFCLRDADSRGAKKIAVVTHGGVIMSIMESLALPRLDYYHWQLQNGCGYQVHTDEERRLPYLYL